jgi:hypothetical protein
MITQLYDGSLKTVLEQEDSAVELGARKHDGRAGSQAFSLARRRGPCPDADYYVVSVRSSARRAYSTTAACVIATRSQQPSPVASRAFHGLCASSEWCTRVTTPASDYTMAPAPNTSAHSTEPHYAGSFEGLFMALNPYMDDVLHQPTFHLLMNLPIVRISSHTLPGVRPLTIVYR